MKDKNLHDNEEFGFSQMPALEDQGLVQEEVTVDYVPPKEEVEEAPESAFLSQWQKRHQEYLASQPTTTNSSEEKQEEKERTPKKPKSLVMDALVSKTPHVVETEEETISVKENEAISTLDIWKSVPVFLLAMILAVFSIYFLSPLSKEKEFTVTGTSALTVDDVLRNSLISKRDYTLTTYLNRSGHAANIQKSSPWLQSVEISYEFPKMFHINVVEYRQIAYVAQVQGYSPVLSSGRVVPETIITQEQLPEHATLLQLKDADLIKTLILQLVAVDQAIMSNIERVELTPSKATADLLSLTMYDGHTILVPLTEVERKLPYYLKIAPQLTVPSIVDMEVGVFSYAK